MSNNNRWNPPPEFFYIEKSEGKIFTAEKSKFKISNSAASPLHHKPPGHYFVVYLGSVH